MPAPLLGIGFIDVVPMPLTITKSARLRHRCPLDPPLPPAPYLDKLDLMTRFPSLTAILVALFTVSCGSGSAPARRAENAPAAPPAWNVSVEPLDVPAGGRSVEPHLTASSRGLLLSWVEQSDRGAALKYAERTQGMWSEPRTVASGNNWFLSYADMPTVLRLRDGTLVANWYLTTNLLAEGYDILLAYSKDDGKTWSRPFKPHRDKTKTQHGFVSIFESPAGGVGLVWLDARDQENNTTDPEGGVVSLYAASFDAAWKHTGESVVNRRVCECCTTAAAVTDAGVIAAFRDRSDKEIRNIAVTRLEGGTWTEASVVHDDNWEIDSCPINGPSLSARGRDVAIAWFTAKDDKGRAFAAFSKDGGRTWGTPIQLEDQVSRGYVDIEMLEDGSAVATWVEFADGRSQLKARRVESSGARSAAVSVGKGEGGVTGYPRVARSGNELVFVWNEGSGEEAQRMKAALVRLR
jgi:hypothetical protein